MDIPKLKWLFPVKEDNAHSDVIDITELDDIDTDGSFSDFPNDGYGFGRGFTTGEGSGGSDGFGYGFVCAYEDGSSFGHGKSVGHGCFKGNGSGHFRKDAVNVDYCNGYGDGTLRFYYGDL